MECNAILRTFEKMYFFSFLSIIGWVALLYQWRKTYLAYYPILVCTGLISLLYISSFLKILNFTADSLFIFGLLLLINFAYSTRKTIFQPAKKWLPKSWSVGLVFFIVSGVLWYIFTFRATIFGWDEFFWGQFTKAILNSNNFYNLSSAIFIPTANYPPGGALFQYYFLHLFSFSESALYFAQGLIVLSALSLVLDLAKRNLRSLLIITLVLFSAFLYFGPGLLSITNDHVIGVIFGSCVLAIFFILRSTKSKLLLIPVIFSLPLIKVTGLVLSLTIVLTAILDLIVSNPRLPKKENGGPRINKFVIALILILVLSPLLGTMSWNFYLKRQGVEATTSLPGLSEIKNAFSNQASDREKLTISNFTKALVSSPLNQQEGIFKSDQPFYKLYLKAVGAINRPGLSIVMWFLIFTILFGIVFYAQSRAKRSATFAIYISLIIGLAAYLFLHLLAYLFHFSDFEGTNLAAMDRYISTYFLGFAIVTVGLIAAFVKENPNNIKLAKGSLLAIFLYLFIFHTPPLTRLILPPKMVAASTNSVRERTHPFSSYINLNTEDSSKVWLIYQNTNGWESMIIRYDITPRTMNTGSWSLGSRYGSDDRWTNTISAENFAKLLSDDHFNYVFLAKVDDNFWSSYDKLFVPQTEAKSHQLFKVEQKDNKTLLVAK